jgi:hypothetical protein
MTSRQLTRINLFRFAALQRRSVDGCGEARGIITQMRWIAKHAVLLGRKHGDDLDAF